MAYWVGQHFRVAYLTQTRFVNVVCKICTSRKDVDWLVARCKHSAVPKAAGSTQKDRKIQHGSKISGIRTTGGTKSPFTHLLSSMSSIEAVLDAAYNSKSSLEVSHVLQRLVELCSKDPRPSEEEVCNVLNSDRFQKLSAVLDKEAITLPPPVLLSSLGCLLTLTPGDTHIIQSLETQVLWMLRKMPISQVYRVLEIHKGHCTTDLRRQVCKETWVILERRWVEIRSAGILVSLMYKVDPDSKFMTLLEDRALELADQFSAKELYRILYILGRNAKRNSPLLYALAYHLNRQAWNFSPLQLSNLAYACGHLNFYDAKFLHAITDALMESIPMPELVPFIPSIIRSFSTIRWLDKNAMDHLCENLLQNMSTVSNATLHSILLSCAHLNYIPKAVDNAWQEIMTAVNQASIDEPARWLEYVWCITVLHRLDGQLAASVFQPDFLEKLKDKPEDESSVSNLRLLNINFSCHLELRDFQGPGLPIKRFSETAVKLPSSRKLLTEVIEAITNIAPSEKYLKQDMVTPAGHVADLVIVVNAKGEPQPLEGIAEPWPAPNKKKLPNGFHRIVIQVLDYQDLTSNFIQPIGLRQLAARHLALMGFKVVQVPYDTFSKETTIVKKVQYLQNMINTAIGAQDSSAT